MRVKLTLTLLFSIISTYLMMAQHWGSHTSCWELAIEKNAVEVYVHRSTESGVRGFKAVTTIGLPLDSIEVIFDDIESYADWQVNVKDAKIMHEVSDMMYHFNTRTSLPWPSKNQDLMWRAEKDWDEIDGSLVYNQVCSNNTMPEKIRKSSVVQAFASWRLTPMSEHEVKITYYLTVDKRGKIPGWVINFLNPDSPYETLHNLQAMSMTDTDEMALE